MKKTLLFALMALLCLGNFSIAQAQCTSYAGGPYNDQEIDVAGCDGTSISAPYNAWLNEVYFTDVLAGGNYTFDICTGYDPTTWGGEATITAILNGTPSGAPPGTIDGGTLLGSVTGCSITFNATADGTVFFVISTEADCGGALLQVDNGLPTVTTNSGVPCGGCGNGTCDVGESYGNCPGDCPCSTTPVFATFSPAGQPAISPVPTAFCESFFTGDPAAAAVAYVAVAVFPGDGALYDFTNEDGFDFYGIDATGFFPSSQFEPGFIGFMLITDDLIAAAGGTTTINLSDGAGCNGSLTIDWAADFPGLVVADLCGEPPVTTPGADACADALTLDVTDGAVNGPYSNTTATGEDPVLLVPPACFGDDIDPLTGENYFDNSVWFSFVGTGQTLVLTTSVAGAPSPMPNADTQLGVYIGACDDLFEIACNDDIDVDGGNYLSSVTVATEAGVTYYVVIDGYFYGDGMGGGAPDAGDFFVNVAVQATTDCMADYGTVVPPAETTICQNGIVGAFNLEGGNTSADYLSLFVVTTGPELTILGYADAGTDIDLTGLPAGQYTFHAFNFLLADAGAIDAAVSGGATGVDVAGLIADGTICAELDVTGVVVTILPATDPACAGFPDLVVSAPSTTIGGNQYVVVFTIDSGTGDYTVIPEGNLDGNTFVSNPVDCGTNAEFTVFDNLSGQSAIVSVEAPCSGFVCEANYGMVMAGSTSLCEGNFSDPITVMDDNTNGYTSLLVITQGPELTIVGTSGLGSIDFTGLAPGDYTVHALNILNADIDAINTVPTGFDVAALIADGTICADLDVDGVVFTIFAANSEFCNPQVPPAAGNADYNIVVGTESFDVNLWNLVSDPNGDLLTLEAGSPDQGGSVSFDTVNGILTFTPDAGFIGTATILYTVTDGFSNPVSGTITITVELSCETLDPIGFDVIELISNPVTGDVTSYLLISGGLPGFDGSTYVLNAYNDEGAVLFSVNDIPTGVIYELGPVSTAGDDTLDITITDGLGCTKDFVVAILSGGLDVQLVSFTGTVQERGNMLNWATAAEVNNDYYTLYRSADGVNYQKIAQVDGKGTTSMAGNYQFLDENAPNGIAYYQLAQTDFDGTSAMLGTVVLRRNTTALSVVQVAPVPATNMVNIIFVVAAAERVQISLFDVAGKMVSTQNIQATAGNNTALIAVDQLPAGVYMLNLNDGVSVVTAKVVKN